MKIVFFDGVCSLCNGVVDTLMRLDKSEVLKFASLQGETARQLLSEADRTALSTIIYLREGERFEKSAAVLKILSDIGGVWSTIQIFLTVPTPIRNFLYDLVAENRYRLMPRRERCRIPTSEELNRFLP